MDPQEQEWQKTVERFLHPFRVRKSEPFVQNVMRVVRQLPERDAGIRWPSFARWAFPALGFSMTGFALALTFSLRAPVAVSAEALWRREEQVIMTAWLPNAATEETGLPEGEEIQ